MKKKKKKTAGKDAEAGILIAIRARGPDGKIRRVLCKQSIFVLNFHCSHFQTWYTRAFDI